MSELNTFAYLMIVLSAVVSVAIVLVYIKILTLSGKNSKRKYFVSYVTQKHHQPAFFQNCVSDINPITWQIQQNENSNGMRYRIISWRTISDKEAKIFEEGKSH